MVTVKDLIEHFELKNYTPEVDANSIVLTLSTPNRPALQLAGYYDHFENERVQLIGNVESGYIDSLPVEKQRETFEALLEHDVPCIVFSTDRVPKDMFLEECREHKIPCLGSGHSTSNLMAEMMRWLNVEMAPSITIHGVLLDIFGEGVLITGESGVGKSEAALELIKRGHRLVSDDVVEIKKVSDATIIGQAPNVTRHFIELRGVGIIDVKSLYGVECVKDTQQIDMEIHLEEWNKNTEYDRIGLSEHYSEYLGNKVVCHTIPIRPGRNLAIICETAAVNHRQKKMGYNAAQALYEKVQANIAGGIGL